ncbi:hypothetical protein ALO79_200334 [Pseudomonas syringae pv. castaneae]|uniref:Uncharacterized protein n=1 Tax=Pseudomonas syringae pv. castaneae TaxID=264450 RepID=A0A0N8R3T1_PSESX|nr:hypothetical protein ALO79_200334 [Pseudomonas syringae pv. castaneae]
MPMNTASYSSSSCSMVTSLPTSVFRRNSIPMPVKTSRRLLSTVFSNLNSGMPKVSRPPISGFLSNTTGVTPPRTRTSAQPRPAGPAPMMATRLPVGLTLDMSGRQPMANAVSVMYFSTEPMVTAPKPSFKVQAPSHRRSCGQTRPQTSGRVLVWWDSSAAWRMLPSATSLSQLGMKLCTGHFHSQYGLPQPRQRWAWSADCWGLNGS